ncbi:multicopper oxidase domain-containing protein [Paraburkholderia sabiae]|uniref:Multicopper oxidase family protein n=1 Tax=Paraburkholderia sabiae TaxID=273251 RepID=A0ABU9Q8N8_9BURK|nr:multicopper oxidase family protein [Paraburkholderia sabiae]WJZ79163.1 multicopper oxidase family protein [Paraburkholderia sabiae]
MLHASFYALLVAVLICQHARAAAPGITGTSFDLTAQADRISQPDGSSVYSWGYGCRTAPAGFSPANVPGANCPGMQVPGPTLIVKQGDVVTVTLTNNLPEAAGNTSILFPGFQVCAAQLNSDGTCPTALTGVPGLLTREATHGNSVTYSFVAATPGTHAYYSGTQGDLQVEMGLSGAIIVLPTSAPGAVAVPAGCRAVQASLPDGQPDFRNAAAAYNHPSACYDREYLFQFSEMDPRIHAQAEQEASKSCTQPTGCMSVETEPYHPAYFMINGRSMPDDMDPNYAQQYPHQPYNGNPHMHPGELVLLRVIGSGRWQHPFHEHGNHVRVLARDGNLMLSKTDATKLAGPLLFTTTTTPGLAMDGIFYWTGKGLNWDVYGHTAGDGSVCIPDANGYYTVNSNPPAPPNAPNYYEWCADHNKALEAHPFGNVGSGGPVTLPDARLFTNGAWYGGSPYLGPDATVRATSYTGTTPPSGTIANSPTSEAGFAYMWHSHNEREITTDNIFPGGMMMMMLVDPQAFTINEGN